MSFLLQIEPHSQILFKILASLKMLWVVSIVPAARSDAFKYFPIYKHFPAFKTPLVGSLNYTD